MPTTGEIKPTARRGPPWDGYDAYLFDIDGTLLHCADAVHYFAFCEALTALAGRPVNLDGVTAHGNTDVGILRDALNLAGVPEEQWRPRLGDAKIGMCRFVEAGKKNLRVTILPGVRELLRYLKGRGALLGVATGNLEAIGGLKLEHCGLLASFDFGAYSDAYEYRRDVFSGGLAKAKGVAGARATVCVVGDTPEDIRAAKANSIDVIAVATGLYSFDELQAHTPDWCVRSLHELLEPGGYGRCF